MVKLPLRTLHTIPRICVYMTVQAVIGTGGNALFLQLPSEVHVGSSDIVMKSPFTSTHPMSLYYTER